MELSPRIGTVLTGKGKVVARDVTVHGLHRMCVELMDGYPDVQAWLSMLPKGARVMAHNYDDKRGLVFVGYLWMYWKE